MSGARAPEVGGDLTTFQKLTIERTLERCRVMSVGRVVRFIAGADGPPPTHPTCSVQILTPRFVDDAPAVFDDILDDVPVAFLGTRGLRFDHRLTDGDLVLVLAADRSMDEIDDMLSSIAVQDPQKADPRDPRTHDITDALALPISVRGNATQVDFIELMRDFLSLVQTATTGTGVATLNPALQVTVQAMVARLNGVL